MSAGTREQKDKYIPTIVNYFLYNFHENAGFQSHAGTNPSNPSQKLDERGTKQRFASNIALTGEAMHCNVVLQEWTIEHALKPSQQPTKKEDKKQDSLDGA